MKTKKNRFSVMQIYFKRATVTDTGNAESDKRRNLYNFDENYPEDPTKKS